MLLNEWIRHIKVSEQIYFKYLKVHLSDFFCICTSPPSQHVISRTNTKIIRFHVRTHIMQCMSNKFVNAIYS